MLVRSRPSPLSLRRALGEGPDALALLLTGLWIAGTLVLPLGHAVEHATAERAHCHASEGAQVCHGGDAEERAAEPTVREASRAELSVAADLHVALLATPVAAPLLVGPARQLLPVVVPAAADDVHTGRAVHHAAARGPPAA